MFLTCSGIIAILNFPLHLIFYRLGTRVFRMLNVIILFIGIFLYHNHNTFHHVISLFIILSVSSFICYLTNDQINDVYEDQKYEKYLKDNYSQTYDISTPENFKILRKVYKNKSKNKRHLLSTVGEEAEVFSPGSDSETSKASDSSKDLGSDYNESAWTTDPVTQQSKIVKNLQTLENNYVSPKNYYHLFLKNLYLISSGLFIFAKLYYEDSTRSDTTSMKCLPGKAIKYYAYFLLPLVNIRSIKFMPKMFSRTKVIKWKSKLGKIFAKSQKSETPAVASDPKIEHPPQNLKNSSAKSPNKAIIGLRIFIDLLKNYEFLLFLFYSVILNTWQHLFTVLFLKWCQLQVFGNIRGQNYSKWINVSNLVNLYAIAHLIFPLIYILLVYMLEKFLSQFLKRQQKKRGRILTIQTNRETVTKKSILKKSSENQRHEESLSEKLEKSNPFFHREKSEAKTCSRKDSIINLLQTKALAKTSIVAKNTAGTTDSENSSNSTPQNTKNPKAQTQKIEFIEKLCKMSLISAVASLSCLIFSFNQTYFIKCLMVIILQVIFRIFFHEFISNIWIYSYFIQDSVVFKNYVKKLTRFYIQDNNVYEHKPGNISAQLHYQNCHGQINPLASMAPDSRSQEKISTTENVSNKSNLTGASGGNETWPLGRYLEPRFPKGLFC